MTNVGLHVHEGLWGLGFFGTDRDTKNGDGFVSAEILNAGETGGPHILIKIYLAIAQCLNRRHTIKTGLRKITVLTPEIDTCTS